MPSQNAGNELVGQASYLGRLGFKKATLDDYSIIISVRVQLPTAGRILSYTIQADSHLSLAFPPSLHEKLAISICLQCISVIAALPLALQYGVLLLSPYILQSLRTLQEPLPDLLIHLDNQLTLATRLAGPRLRPPSWFVYFSFQCDPFFGSRFHASSSIFSSACAISPFHICNKAFAEVIVCTQAFSSGPRTGRKDLGVLHANFEEHEA